MDHANLRHIQNLQLYSELLRKNQLIYFRPFEKNRKVVKLVDLDKLQLTLKDSLEMVLEFMDLMLLASLEKQTLHITYKVVSTKTTAFYYYVMGGPKKLGFKAIEEKDYINELLLFQRRVQLANRIQHPSQSSEQEQWNEWTKYVQTPQFIKKLDGFATVSEQIHFVINNFGGPGIGQKFNLKTRMLRYVVSARISYAGMGRLLQISERPAGKQSAQIIYHSKVKETRKILQELCKEKVASYLKSSTLLNTNSEEADEVSSNFSLHSDQTTRFAFFLSLGNKTEQFDHSINLEEKEVATAELVKWARRWMRVEVQVKFCDQQILLSIKTLPFWKIYSKNFVQIETALLSSQEHIIKNLLSETKQAYLLDPTRLAFSRWTKKIEIGLCLEQQIKVTSKSPSMCQLLLCCLDRQMLVWSILQRELQQNCREWGEAVQTQQLDSQRLGRKLKNGYNCYLAMKSGQVSGLK